MPFNVRRQSFAANDIDADGSDAEIRMGNRRRCLRNPSVNVRIVRCGTLGSDLPLHIQHLPTLRGLGVHLLHRLEVTRRRCMRRPLHQELLEVQEDDLLVRRSAAAYRVPPAVGDARDADVGGVALVEGPACVRLRTASVSSFICCRRS